MSINIKSFGDDAALLATLGNERRLEILRLISSGEMSVTTINRYVDLSQSALSQHLNKLRHGKLVKTRRDAQTIYYSILDKRVFALLELLDSFERDVRAA